MSDRKNESETTRAQSHVVGVVLLLGIATVSMGVLAASAGVVVDSTAASADAERAAASLAEIDPTAERQRVRVKLLDARLQTVERQVRVGVNGTNGSETTWNATFDANALVYDNGETGARFLGGAVQRGNRGFERPPAIGRGGNELVLSVATLVGEIDRRGSGTVRLRTNAAHGRRTLGGADTLAVETAHTGPWELAFERAGANVTVRDVDGDGVPSVLGTFPVEGVSLARHELRIRTVESGA